jgi:hypothetical protein
MTSGKAKTFYIPFSAEKDWLNYQELCNKKLNLSASKRLNQLWKQDLCSLAGKENSNLDCSLESKFAAKLAIEKKEHQIREYLEKKILSNRKSAFEGLFYLAIKLGSDETLEKDLVKVREKLILYQITSNDCFSKGDRQLFIIYIDFVLKRRALESEIELLLSNNASVEPSITFQEIAPQS